MRIPTDARSCFQVKAVVAGLIANMVVWVSLAAQRVLEVGLPVQL
ncbi:MAG: hypothetical protein ABJA86_13625 [Nocardioidaceae bacterium]